VAYRCRRRSQAEETNCEARCVINARDLTRQSRLDRESFLEIYPCAANTAKCGPAPGAGNKFVTAAACDGLSSGVALHEAFGERFGGPDATPWIARTNTKTNRTRFMIFAHSANHCCGNVRKRCAGCFGLRPKLVLRAGQRHRRFVIPRASVAAIISRPSSPPACTAAPEIAQTLRVGSWKFELRIIKDDARNFFCRNESGITRGASDPP